MEEFFAKFRVTYLPYLRYVLRHKYYVYVEGRRLGVNPVQLFLHDMSKFLPDEFFPYAEWFNGRHGAGWYNVTSYKKIDEMTEKGIEPKADDFYRASQRAVAKLNFDRAWLKHIHRNPHHWQFYILREDSGEEKLLPMPEKYRLEMLADWTGAGIAITGKRDLVSWYDKTKENRKLEPTTLMYVNKFVDQERSA